RACHPKPPSSQLPISCMLLALLIVGALAHAAPIPKQIGPGANSTFLVGTGAILVVDTGVDSTEGNKLLAA
ncbi:MAG TPA: hypothetical protein VLL05_13010, partial [Terriglobales bacterium]|nr:hypothetical protein [Terriglobales bacterium]